MPQNDDTSATPVEYVGSPDLGTPDPAARTAHAPQAQNVEAAIRDGLDGLIGITDMDEAVERISVALSQQPDERDGEELLASDSELLAAFFRNERPDLGFEGDVEGLSPVEAAMHFLRRETRRWRALDDAPRDGRKIILAKHGWTKHMGDLKQGSPEWRAAFFDDSTPQEYRCWWVSRGYWDINRQKWTDGLDALADPTHWMPDFALPKNCDVPPIVWARTRSPGHEGPCATIPAHLKGSQ